jgi:hypothetical protein
MGVTDLTQAENKTREEILWDLGIRHTTILEKLGKANGIEEVRDAFEYIWIADECVYLEQCCLNYTKTWNPLLEVWRDEPRKTSGLMARMLLGILSKRVQYICLILVMMTITSPLRAELLFSM